MGRLNENERQAEIFKRSFAGLCEFGHYPHHFDYVTEDNDVFVRLLMEYDEHVPAMALVFPRSDKMKPYYPAIREWFDFHGIKWKDRSRNKKRYMFALVDKDPVRLENMIRNISKTVFNTDKLTLDARGANSIFKRFAVSRHLVKYTLVLATAVITSLLFALYELLRVFDLSYPSMTNIDIVEFRMLGTLIICRALIEILRVRPRLHKPAVNASGPKWWAVAILFGPPVAMFFTA